MAKNIGKLARLERLAQKCLDDNLKFSPELKNSLTILKWYAEKEICPVYLKVGKGFGYNWSAFSKTHKKAIDNVMNRYVNSL